MSRLSAKVVLIVIIFLVLPGLGSPADLALNYPTKPIKLIIPSQAGGGHDLTFRAVTSVSAEFLGQPILVQLEPGGLGAIGSDQVAKAKPDGYTLLAGGAGWSSAPPAIDGRSKGPDDLDAVPKGRTIWMRCAGSTTTPSCSLPVEMHHGRPSRS
jgi:tripartite-type tricarboxylate transporter receptor subunit TctC